MESGFAPDRTGRSFGDAGFEPRPVRFADREPATPDRQRITSAVPVLPCPGWLSTDAGDAIRDRGMGYFMMHLAIKTTAIQPADIGR